METKAALESLELDPLKFAPFVAARGVAAEAAVTTTEAVLMSLEGDKTLSEVDKKKRVQTCINAWPKWNSEYGCQIHDSLHPRLREHCSSLVLRPVA